MAAIDEWETQFTEMVKKAAASYIHDRIAERLNIVVKSAEEDQKANDDKKVEVPGNKKDAEIITTQVEIEAYYTIKAILRSIVPGKRVVMRDALSYCAILLDDNNRKPICKLHFNNEANLRVEIFDANGNSEKVHIDNIDDLYNYANLIIESTKRFL